MRPRRAATPTCKSVRLTSRSSRGEPDVRSDELLMASSAGASIPGGIRIWLMAARPRTLPAAVAPVLVGTALAGFGGVFHALRLVAALLGALFIQVGTNLSNDYSDARRGADAEDRLGPVRVTAGGLVPPKQGPVATYVSFSLARAGRALPGRGRRLAAAAGRRGLDPRRRLVHRWTQAVWLRGLGRAVRVPVLRDRRCGGVVLRGIGKGD